MDPRRQSSRGESYLKWIVAFGNQSASVLIVGTVAERESSGAESAFKQTLLSARWTPPTGPRAVDMAGLPFTLHLQPGFEILGRVGPSIVVGLAGTRLPDKSGGPRLVVAASTEAAPVAQLASIASGLFRTITPDLISDRVILSSQPVKIAGRQSHEVRGTAKHRDGYPVAVYLVVVSEADGHLQAFGQCRAEAEANNMPAFQRMTEGLSLVQQ